MSSVAPPDSPRAPADAGRRVWVFGGLLVAAALLAWSNSFSGPFVLDDMPAITENPTIRGFASAFSPPGDGQTVSGRPLVNLTFALNWAIGGASVRGYHVFNLTIHVLAALALFGVVRRTLQALPSRMSSVAAPDSQLLAAPKRREGGSTLNAATTPLAFAIAALWVLHPLQTESVTYLSQRAESLAGLCLLLTLYAAIRGAEATCHLLADKPRSVAAAAWHALAFVACLAGMAAKEIMYAAPLLVLLHDRTFSAGTFRAALGRRPWFYGGLASTWALLGWLVWHTGNRGMTAGFGLGISPWNYLLTQCGALVHYLRLTGWPAPLVLDHGFSVVTGPAGVWPQAGLLIALAGITLVGLARAKPWSFLGAWFFLLLAPSSSVLPVATQTIAEHRMYLALAAVIAGGVLALWSLLGRRSFGVLALIAVALGALTAHRNRDYRSAIGLWQDTIAKRPENARAFGELANALFLAGRLDESLAAYERALGLLSNFPKTHHNYAGALAAAGRRDEAAAQYQIALAQSPALPDAYYGLGNVRREQGRIAEAIACYEAALRFRPDFAPAHNNLANLLAATGRVDEAGAHFAAALRALPNFADAEYNWGNTLARANRPAEAVPHFEAAVRLAPGLVGAHENLGVTLLMLDRTAEGIRELETAQRLAPDRESVRTNLAIARQRLAP